MNMRYVDFSAGPSVDDLVIAECERPPISPDEVLVKVQAFGVNRADTLQRQGKYPPPPGESKILGLEVSGEIVALGGETSEWEIGDSVCGLVAGGGYAEYVALDARLAMPIPSTVSTVDAAGLPEVFLTAFQALVAIGDLQHGQRVLIHAGASGVGLAAIQLARHLNCDIAVTASSQAKLDACAQMGAAHLINYTEHDFVSVLKDRKWQADVIVDFVGGDYLNRNLNVIAMDGRIIYLAMLGGRYADALDMAKLLAKRASIHGSTLRNRSLSYKRKLVSDFLQQFYDGFEQQSLGVNRDTCYSVEEIAQAHARIEANQTIGKLLVSW